MLGEHELTFLARGGTLPPPEVLGELHVRPCVVLAEGWIGDDAVEAFQFASIAVHRVEQCIFKLNVRAGHAVEKHVQSTYGPRRGVVDLAAEAEVGGITTGLFDEFANDDEHAARPAREVIDAHARSRL